MKKAYFFKNLILMFLVPSVFVGCAPSTDEALDRAVQTHIKAETSAQAEDACRKVFISEQKKEKPESTELCEALLKRTDAELSICEDEITDRRFSSLVASCKSQLLVRLDQIKIDRNDGLDVEKDGLNFKIPFEIQLRDLSNGYTAKTGDTLNKQVILSFDDGPHPVLTKKIAAALEKVGVRAHFLQVGKNVKAYPEVTKLLSARGHSIGNHSWDHSDFTKLTFEQQVKQISDTNKIILQTIGWIDPFFRYPYGAATPQLNAFLKEHQEASFLWSIDSNDWKKINSDNTIRTNAQVIRETLEQLDKKGRGLVLFHDVQARTAELLPAFLTSLYKKGYKVVMLQASNSQLKSSPLLP